MAAHREEVRQLTSRRTILILILLATLVASTLMMPLKLSPANVSDGALSIRGAGISFALLEERSGTVYSRNGKPAHIEQILADSGANYARIRLWVGPPRGYSDLATDLEVARRATKVGLKIFLDLHYSDTWADSKHQTTPAAWQTFDLPTLVRTVRDYTRDVIGQFARQDTPVDMVQIGNEVTNGMLWPVGQIYRQTGEDWASFVALLNAGIEGARQGNDPTRRLSVVIHYDHGGDNDGARYFFDNIFAAGVASFDAIGLSYYPFWHGALSKLQNNLDDLATRYKKILIVSETAYPWTLQGGDPDIGFADVRKLPEADAYPPTVAGQERYIRALRSVLLQVPFQRGVGLFVFGAGWLRVGWRPGAGNPWTNLTMFDWSGRMLPALAVAMAPPT